MKADHGSEWIFALQISACSLHISIKAVRIAISLCLGLNLCEPYSCPCGGAVDAKDLHRLSCKCSVGCFACNQQLNDPVWCALRRENTQSKNLSVCFPRKTNVLTGLHYYHGTDTHPRHQPGMCMEWCLFNSQSKSIIYLTYTMNPHS